MCGELMTDGVAAGIDQCITVAMQARTGIIEVLGWAMVTVARKALFLQLPIDKAGAANPAPAASVEIIEQSEIIHLEQMGGALQGQVLLAQVVANRFECEVFQLLEVTAEGPLVLDEAPEAISPCSNKTTLSPLLAASRAKLLPEYAIIPISGPTFLAAWP